MKREKSLKKRERERERQMEGLTIQKEIILKEL